MEPILLVALSNAVVQMPAVVDALSKDPAVLSLTATVVLLLIKSTEKLEFVVSNEACIEVSKSDDIKLDCGTCVSTPVVNKL
jgi:hypothetical protein